MKRHLLLIPILTVALLVRVYRLNTPLADWHSWRQADTAAVTRRYVQEGVDLLHPKYDDLSSIPSGKENPQGYRMVEFPFVNATTAWLYQFIPNSLEIHIFSRLVSIFFSLGSLVFLYLLIQRLSNYLEAILAAVTFALLPYNIFFSRVVLPEVPLVFFILGMMYFFVRGNIWLYGIFATLGFLLKPTTIFFLLPLAYWHIKQHSFTPRPLLKTILVTLGALVPFLLWRQWIQQFPEGIPAFTWLLNGNGIRFKGAWFRWLFADRYGRLILGYFGLIPFALGLLPKPKEKEGWFYHVWLLGTIAYLAVFATGNVQHDYYQIITIPIICVFIAKGVIFLLRPPIQLSRALSIMLLVISSAFALAFGWFHIRDYFNINHPEIIEAGEAANHILPPEAKVIAPYQGDTAFLYQTNRRGWPIGGNIKDKIKQGATDYITTTLDDEANELISRCVPSVQTATYTIISLRNCAP